MCRVLVSFAVLIGCSSNEVPIRPPLEATPLPARTAPAGSRFARLDPAACGIQFRNELRRQHVIPYLYNGAGVAIGDYDGDGLPDVYLVSQDGANKLFRQVAPLRFEDVTDAAGGLDGGAAWGSAATFADVDGDGDLDLYVCNTEAPNLLYQNRGDGTFVECAGKFGLAISAASSGAAFADYDNDGDLDLYLVTNRVLGPTLPTELIDEIDPPANTRATRRDFAPPVPSLEYRDGKPIIPTGYEDQYFAMDHQVYAAGQPDRLLRNDGYAQFRDVTESAGIAGHGMGLSATWWDCDGDGWLDLYIANDLESPDQLYHNRRDGRFENITARALPHTAYFGMGSDFGDIDNDGHMDLCVADMSSTTHYMSKMLMGNMGDRRWFLMNANPPQYMRNALFVNTGTERFLEAAQMAGLASTDWTWSVLFADLDEDGWLDFFATNGIPRFDNDPDAANRFRQLWRLGQHEQALDLARNMPEVAERNVARRNRGGLDFEDVGASWGLAEAGVSQGAAIADLDRDGDLDIVVNNLNSPASVFENRSADQHRILVELRGAADNTFGVGSRITAVTGATTQTRITTITRGYMSAGEPVAHFGLGSATTVDRLTVRWPTGVEQVFENLAADHRYTVAQPATATAAKPAEVRPKPWFEPVDAIAFEHRERPFDDYAGQPLLPHRLSQLGPGLAWGDADGDGRDDLWVGGAAGQAGALFAARGDGSFTPIDGPWRAHAEREDMGAIWFDADSDGDLDLFVVSGGVESGTRSELLRDRLYRNDGAAGFVDVTETSLPDTRISGGCACAADFDRDGDLDLFVGGRVIAGRYPAAPPSALLRNDAGKFADVTAAIAPALRDAGMVGGALWSDFDADGWPDLIVAAHWSPIRVFRNANGERLDDRTREAGIAQLSGLWNGLAAADLDRDGDIDYVATNLGLNSKYHADPSHPLRIYADDFDGDGTFDVIEAKYEGDALLPVRGRSCSTAAMPFLGEKFRTFDAFARASLPDIYTPKALSAAQAFDANELEHGVLVNQGDGTFRWRQLPRAAQIAPGFGVVIEDFDADGHLDIAIAQNSFSPEPETGRFDGGVGVVLAGRGALGFEALRADRAGVVMPGDGKAATFACVSDAGQLALVCSTNDGPVRSHALRASGPRRVVRLRGPAGNPSGVGARIEVRRDGVTCATHELHAGSGYLSQSAPIAVIGAGSGTELRVLWPDGKVSVHQLADAAAGIVTLRPE